MGGMTLNDVEARLAILVGELQLAPQERLVACVEARARGDSRSLAQILCDEGGLGPAQVRQLEQRLGPLGVRLGPAPRRGLEGQQDAIDTRPLGAAPGADAVETLHDPSAPDPAVSTLLDRASPPLAPPPGAPPMPRSRPPARPAARAQPQPLPSEEDPQAPTARFGADLPDDAASAETIRFGAPPEFRLDDYELLEELGRGGMGVVYRARSLRLDRPCAIKTIRAGEDASARALRRFRNEAVLAARLRHPNVVGVFDAGEAEDQLYIVMELVEGDSLAERAEDVKTPADLEAALRLVLGAARGLAYAHEQGVTHRDVKPDNVLIDREGEARLSDFGLAMGESTRGATIEGRVFGTLHYAPPEQANGELGRIGPLSDVYGLGATLYQVLSGEPPFADERDPVALLIRVMSEEPLPPSALAAQLGRPPVRRELDLICRRAMRKQAAERYPSVQAFVDDLEAALAGEPIEARPQTLKEQAGSLIARRKALLATLALGATLALLLSAGFTAAIAQQTARTASTLRAFERRSALEQAETLAEAIRIDMLNGRADLARALDSELRGRARVAVVRPDRTLAYVDHRTRRRVEARLGDPRVRAAVTREFPQLGAAIEALERTALPRLDALGEGEEPPRYEAVHPVTWRRALTSLEPQVEASEREGEPQLFVVLPLENGRQCQACHGPAQGTGLYEDDNRVRAMVVVQRSQAELEEAIAASRREVYAIGALTFALALVALLGLGRLLGLGPRRRFGQPGGEAGA